MFTIVHIKHENDLSLTLKKNSDYDYFKDISRGISKFGVKPGNGDTKIVIFMYSILQCENKHSDWVSCLNEGKLNFTMIISFFAHVVSFKV